MAGPPRQARLRDWEWCDDERALTHARKPRHDTAPSPQSPSGALGRELSRDIARLDREAAAATRSNVEYVDYAFEPAVMRERYRCAELESPRASAREEDPPASPAECGDAPPAPPKAMRFAYT